MMYFTLYWIKGAIPIWINTEAKPSRVDKIVPFFEMKVQRCTKKLPKAQNAEKWREGIEERNEMQTIE